ncbi:ABC transporter substrate-binding protein [Nocardioides oleivorans]|uniref:ABC transporter substrate-binding protein n=1 Tax=Nocardioides oleivorans TaxID=273676 RepID=A0A4Q2RZM7_9ACTN|nr:ABC transporter substrate-binding protein [Nocardioides oleivorans]RYB94326.1 ABC transporter substrate-binding protein [Nocardioides oleivorans]
MPHPVRRLAAAVASTALVALGASACSGASAQITDADGVTTLRYQATPGLMNYAELAAALGYLDGIELQNIGTAQGGPEQLRGLATGQAEFAVGPFNGAIARAVSTGLDMTAVVGSYGTSGDVEMSLLTLASSDLRDGHDLIGKTVGVNTLGANSEALIDTYLADEGLTSEEIEEVTLVPLPGATLEAALRQGQVDGALISFSARASAIKNGGVRDLATDSDFVGDYTGGSTVLMDDFIEQHPDITREFVGALAEAIHWQQTHTKDEVLEVYGDWLAERGREPELATYALWQGNGLPNDGGVLTEHDFSMWLDWLESNGEVEPGSLDVDDVFTNEFNPYADHAADEEGTR